MFYLFCSAWGVLYGCWWVCNPGIVGGYCCQPCPWGGCCGGCPIWGCQGGTACGVVGSHPVFGTEQYQELRLLGYEPVYETQVCDVPKQVLVEKLVYETMYKQTAYQATISASSTSSAIRPKSTSGATTIYPPRCF